MDTVDTHNILVCKENIQPLRQGRDTTKLCAALQAQTDSELQQALEKQRNEFEIRLRSNTSDDPLSDWCEYIRWIEQSFPKQPREGKLNVLLQKCLNKFKDNAKYKNDVRFVKLCIKYAEVEESTVELLSQIHRHGIGVKCAELYIAWAEKYAMNNCFKKANVIYEKGIENHAEPIELLKEAHQNFHAFLVRRMLNAKEEFKPTFLESLLPESRQPYNVLRPVTAGQSDVISNIRVGASVKGSPGKLKMNTAVEKKSKSNTCIKIFEDNENEPATMEPAARLEKIPNRKKASKENTMKPGPWTDKHNKKVPFTIGSTSTPFHVHRDEEEEEKVEVNKRVQAVPSSVLKSHSKKEYDDTLANIPLFYPEPEDKSKVVMYCKDQVYAGGLEFQFEELRAIEYNKRMVENTALETKSSSEKIMPKDQSGAECSEGSKGEENGKSKPRRRRTLFLVPEPPQPILSNKCLTEEQLPTTDYSMNQTIHTKEALSEMQQLWFSKPASPLLHDNTTNKQVGKSILKTTRPCFNLYIDESCLDSFKNVKGRDEVREGPLDLTFKSSSNSDLQTAGKENVQDENRPVKVYENVGSCLEAKETEFSLKDKGQSDGENKENDVPDNYCGPVGKSTRRVTGILTPSEDIPAASLSDLEDEEENEDEDDVEYCPAVQCNTTAVTENLTKAFQFPRNESTPNPRKSCHNRPDFNRSLFEDYGPENGNKLCDNDKECEKLKEISDINGVVEIKRSPVAKEENCMKNLSVIVETSREYKSSSSASSGISTFQSRSYKNYPFTPGDARGTTSSTLVSHSALQKTKGLSLTGYEASTESSHTGMRSRVSAVEKFTVFRDGCDGNTYPNNQPLIDIKESVSEEESDKTPVDNGREDVCTNNIDPFSDDAINGFLRRAGFPASKHMSFFRRIDSSLGTPKIGSCINLGEDSYVVKKIVGEGSYAKVYDLTNKSTGCNVIAKIQKPALEWEFYIIQELHSRLGDKIKADSFLKLEFAYFFQNASVLLTKPVGCGTLLDAINVLKQHPQICHITAVYFTVEMLRILETLHSCKIIHADIKPDNFLVISRNEKPRLRLIDFGRSIDMSLLPQGTTFDRVITTDGFTTTEMRMGKPWTYQVDLYGAANCSHCILFGEYMQVTKKNEIWSITKIIPRYWARAEWRNYFTTLLNIESCDDIPKISTLIEPFQAILTENKEVDFIQKQLNNILNSR